MTRALALIVAAFGVVAAVRRRGGKANAEVWKNATIRPT
jgi:hypothetical protein